MVTSAMPSAFAPAHPGAILREDILPDLGMSKAAIALHLKISRETLYQIINEKRGVTADIAVRLSRAFGTTTGFWLGMQANYDAWHAERDNGIPSITPLRKSATG